MLYIGYQIIFNILKFGFYNSRPILNFLQADLFLNFTAKKMIKNWSCKQIYQKKNKKKSIKIQTMKKDAHARV